MVYINKFITNLTCFYQHTYVLIPISDNFAEKFYFAVSTKQQV